MAEKTTTVTAPQYVPFKTKHTLESRLKESTKIKSRYPDKLPIIVEPTASTDVMIEKNKYLAPSSLSMGDFLYVVRKRLHLAPEEAIYLFTSKNTLISSSMILSEVFEKFADKEDGYLYLQYAFEATFG